MHLVQNIYAGVAYRLQLLGESMGQQITRGKAARFFGSVFVAGLVPGYLCRVN